MQPMQPPQQPPPYYGQQPPGPPGPVQPPGPPQPPEPPRGKGWVVPVGIGVVIGTLIGAAVWVVMSGDDDDTAGGGNGGSTTTTQEPTTTTTTAAGPAPAGGPSLTGTWEGTYECTQGETGMTLSIVDVGGDLDAIMEFYEVDDNPGVPAGAFAMEGTSGAEGIELAGTEWIEEPEGYVMGGLTADAVEGEVEQLEGAVDSEGCTTFDLSRTSPEPWYVGEWKGGYDCGQGMTGLTLTIAEGEGSAGGDGVGADSSVEATFAFYEVPENPGVPSGSYSLQGSYADGGLALDGVEWIEQPDGYVMVGMESDFVTRPDYFAGKVLDPSCTAFLLEKST